MAFLNPDAATAVSHTTATIVIVVALLIGIPLLFATLYSVIRLCRNHRQKRTMVDMCEPNRTVHMGVRVKNSSIFITGDYDPNHVLALQRPANVHVRREERFQRAPEEEGPPPYFHEDTPNHMETERLLRDPVRLYSK